MKHIYYVHLETPIVVESDKPMTEREIEDEARQVLGIMLTSLDEDFAFNITEDDPEELPDSLKTPVLPR